MPDSFDVVVIGGGPAGYPAAIRAAQNKLSVACIDEWKNLDGTAAFGGTCLNAGCIPSKALLESSELYHRAHEEFAAHGIKITGVSLELAQMQKQLHDRLLEVTPTDSLELEVVWRSAADAALEEEPKRGFDSYPEQWLVLITCRDEKHQVELLQRFQNEGLPAKALIS